MSESESVCPADGTPLKRANSGGGLRFQCSACRGIVITLAVFRHVLMEGVGSKIWVKSATEPASGHPCGFCTRPMRPTPLPAETDTAATVEVCRVCDAVWVPGDQVDLLPMAGSTAGTPAAELRASRCPECGAPFEVSADGRCPYCRRQVDQQPEVVFFHDGAGMSGTGHDSRAKGHLLGAAAGIAVGVLFGG
jgi:hypothetical protein